MSDTVRFRGVDRKVTATLTDAARYENQGDPGHVFLAGTVRGQRIKTSYIVEEIGTDVFLTRSGDVYRVESWRVEP